MSNPFSSARDAWNTFVEYPGWLESLFGIVGGVLFTVLAISANTPLTERPGLQMTTRYMGDAFSMLGVLLAAFHAYALMTYNRDVRRGLALRTWASFCTTTFWSYFMGTIYLQAFADGRPLPIFNLGGVLLVMIGTVLTFRLRRGYV